MRFNIYTPLLFATIIASFPDYGFSQEKIDLPRFVADSTELETTKSKKDLRRERREAVLESERKAREEALANEIPYENEVYDNHIHTLLVYRKGFQLNPPIIALGGLEKIEVRFDDFFPYVRNFEYTVVHCTHDWKNSNLIESEYIEGFYTNYINDYLPSFNTLQPYTHHRFEFPNRDLRITRSGNYLLKVYHEGNPDSLVFTHRFMIAENKVSVTGEAVAPRHVPLRQEGQEIRFSVHHGAFPIQNPYRDLHVKIIQNDQWSNAITSLKPVFVKNSELVYDYDAPATFMGGNEFRLLDLKSFTYKFENILKAERTPMGWQVLLVPDEKRVFRRYLTYEDINGRALIKNDDGFDDHTESDYANVHFTLRVDQPMIRSDIFVYGGFNHYQLNDDNKMTYDPDINSYKCSMMLKQGFYNYQYAVLEGHRNDPDITILEGSHMETENNYTILVYYRDFSNNYDQLIGVSYVIANRR